MRHAARRPSLAPGRLARPVLALALSLLTGVGAASPARLTGLSVAPAPGMTRVVLELAGTAAARVFTLEHPNRVVVDLKTAVGPAPRLRAVPDSPIRAVRVAPRPGGVLRVVLDLERPLEARLAASGEGGVTIELSAPGAAPPPSAPATGVAASRTTAAAPARDIVIAVDAGHGGADPGATGRDGTREKDVTLAIARVLAARIDAEPGMKAVLTRSDDRLIKLPERVRRAHDAQADLFVSVHADAVQDRSVSGSSVYVLSARGATSEAAKELADRENAADLVGGVSLHDKDEVLASVLLDLSQSAAMSASSVAAGKVLEELDAVGDIRKGTVQRAGFVVLKSPDIPSLLIESAYITNPGEERRLRDPQYQVRLAQAILAGLRGYFREYPPPGSRLAALLTATADARGGSAGDALPR